MDESFSDTLRHPVKWILRCFGHSPSTALRRSSLRKAQDIAEIAHIEQLEERALLSLSNVLATMYAQPSVELVQPAASTGPTGYTPSQIQVAYGFDKLAFPNGLNGTGQTIAIVDAYHNPTILSDLKAFDAAFGLPDPPAFTVMSQTGSTTNLPSIDPIRNWALEEALDVEWAHSLAPGASIVLVEANSNSSSDLLTAVRLAARLPGVSIVSMSWGGSEFSSEISVDSAFTTPSAHQGVTFIASTGDNGMPGGYPAYSPNVLAVGGTTLQLSSTGSYVSEAAWRGSGGGVSQFEPQPLYQRGFVTQTTSKRANPDVSFDADPYSGVAVYSSYANGANSPWLQVGGTSLSAPAWGAVVSIINQGRALNGLTSLDGPSQTIPMLYQLSGSNPSAFHDITAGNNGFGAGSGYDLVTGLGSPVVDVLVPSLTGTVSSATKLVFMNQPTTRTAGQGLGTVTVAIENQNGQVITNDNSFVTISIVRGPGRFSSDSVVSVKAVAGIATFNKLSLTTAGTYQLTASSSRSSSDISGEIKIVAAQATKMLFLQVPSVGTVGQVLSAVSVAIQDQFGNVVKANGSIISIAVASGPGTFSSDSVRSVGTVEGIATFNNLKLTVAGGYTVKVISARLATATSGRISVTPIVTQNGFSLTVRLLSPNVVQLSWASVPNAQGYQIFWSDGVQRFSLGTVRSNMKSVTINGLMPGTNYQFMVEAFNGARVLQDSNWISVNSANFTTHATKTLAAATIMSGRKLRIG